MYLVVGLGNPGNQYQRTRHNVGFLYLDALADLLKVSFSSGKWQGEFARAACDGASLLLLKPQTYMNRSGISVQAAAAFYKIDPAHIVVIHDDLDMAEGRVKVVVNRGAGGHNGIRSITSLLGTGDFIRIKVGIGRPPQGQAAEGYVLRAMSDADIAVFDGLRDTVIDAVRLIVSKGVGSAMNRINAATP